MFLPVSLAPDEKIEKKKDNVSFYVEPYLFQTLYSGACIYAPCTALETGKSIDHHKLTKYISCKVMDTLNPKYAFNKMFDDWLKFSVMSAFLQ